MRFLVFFLCLILSDISLSNGGSIDESNFYRLGTITPLSVTDISLEKELLLIKLEGDYSNITVFYTLKNKGKAKNIKYGFPIDWDLSEMGDAPNNEYGRENILIPYFNIYDGGNKLELTERNHSGLIYEKINHYNIHTDSNEIVTLSLLRKWYTTDLSFRDNETKEITVSYQVKNNFIDWATSKSSLNEYSNRTLLYDFSFAGNWDDGITNELNIIVDATEIFNNYGTCKINGPNGFINCGNKFILKKNNIDLKNLNTLYIEYDNSVYKRSEEITNAILRDNTVSTIKASSELIVNEDNGIYSPTTSKYCSRPEYTNTCF